MTTSRLVRFVGVGLLVGLAAAGVRIWQRPKDRCLDRYHDAQAVPCLPSPGGYKATPQNEATLRRYVSGALKFVVLHEVGHMVSETYSADAPMVGNEEDVADRFASFYLTLHNDDADPSIRKAVNAASSQMLLSAISFWGGLFRDAHGNQDRPITYGEQHPLDAQRAELIGCLLYGSNPDDYTAVADHLRIPPTRRQTCIAESQTNRAAWMQVVQRHLAPRLQDALGTATTMGDAPLPATADVGYDPVPAGVSDAQRATLEHARETTRAVEALEFAADVLEQFESPGLVIAPGDAANRMTGQDAAEMFRGASKPAHADYHVVADACIVDGQPDTNAYWSQSDRQLVVCYQLVDKIESIGRSLIVEEEAQ